MVRAKKTANTAGLKQFLSAQITRRISRVLKELANVRRKPDVTATHDLSTAIRRLLVVDYVVRELFGKRLLEKKLKGKIKDFRNILGKVRNLQEIRGKYEALMLPGRFSKAFCNWLTETEKKTVDALTHVAADFDASELEKLNKQNRIAKVCKGTPVIKPDILMKRLLDDVLAMRERAIQGGDDDALHRMRIRFKRYRYTVELLAPKFADADKKRLKYLREFQTAMGEAHDWLILNDEIQGYAKRHILPGKIAALKKVAAMMKRAHSRGRTWLAANLKNLRRRR
jgi:CHAD domain-containing protein